MDPLRAPFVPLFCPNPDCPSHLAPIPWRFKKMGFYHRQARPRRIQRFLCVDCSVSFSSQTFHPTYWLKRPRLLQPTFFRVLACSAYRQIAREFRVSPSTVHRHVHRLGRHCLLFHETLRPPQPPEPTAIDGFESFEHSQYFPFHLNTSVGARSHFVYAFTDAELRRKGSMTPYQKQRRAELEAQLGRPHPKEIQRSVAELVRLTARGSPELTTVTDEHPAYPRALNTLRRQGWRIEQRTVSSRKPRTASNPLFPVNRLDLLIRHSSANHKRETIAFSKRRGGAILRFAILAVWANTMKSFSERKRDASPAERLGILDRKLTVGDVLATRLFPWRVRPPDSVMRYYREEVVTRALPNGRRHQLKYAF